MDSFILGGLTYQIGYWNDGDFDYTRFAILGPDHTIQFDSRKAGIVIEGGNKASDEHWAEAVYQHGRPAFKFSLADNRPGPASIVVEEVYGKMQVTVMDNAEVHFERLDGEEDYSLVSYPEYGELPLAPSLEAVYTWENNEYTANRELTRRFWEDELQRQSEAWAAKKDITTLDSLLSANLMLGRIDDARKQLSSVSPSIFTGSDLEVFKAYKPLLSGGSTIQGTDFAHWMDHLPPIRKSFKR
ncbi:hypothetical protein KIH86_07775 [Paenibacillus sp. HN-1]|uniref:hypothetical protein n=1 Tax=Paenibacillus TaxID=44249 RepID=UPI001CA82A30|nr:MULTISPECIES: hypothetical protein [Paenibacillus]MBY9078601.1 hypothetical protein [Paenibacillus sp. CGMCC 1.18879]MBY9084137.1 hypothetical protein [Paenibacillus sinensis]